MPPAGYPAFLQYLQSGRVRKLCSRVRKESVSSMGRLPCLGDLLRPQRPRQVAKKLRGSRPVFLLSHLSSKVPNLILGNWMGPPTLPYQEDWMGPPTVRYQGNLDGP